MPLHFVAAFSANRTLTADLSRHNRREKPCSNRWRRAYIWQNMTENAGEGSVRIGNRSVHRPRRFSTRLRAFLNIFAIAHSGFNFMPVRWRTIDAVEAARLAKRAREVLPHRRFGNPAVKRDANPSIVSSMYATQRFP
jgi:hypothetical protein